MAGNYKIKIEPILNTASLNKQLNETKKLKLSTAGQSAGSSFMSGFGRAVKERMKYSVANFLIYGTQNAIKDMVANVRELDKAQTELKKVSDLTGKSLDKFTEQAYETGNKVAKTGTQIIQAATEFKKSGFNESDSLILSKVASMYQNVADVELDAGEAASFIISQMKAFNLEAKDAEHIIDAVNEVSNKYAVSSADIATNIGKASATLAEGNVTYEQSIGLLTAMTEITRSGSKAARGLVTIQSRYNQIIDESSSTGKKLSAWYKEHNIEIKDQNGQLRSFYDVASDVADIWDTLDKNERLYYRNIQAGATQSQNLAALMRNFGTAAGATATAIKSAGSAARENEKYLDSIEGKLNAFQSAWEQLSYHVMNSDFLKDVINLGTDLVKVLDTVVQKIGTLPTLIGLIGTAFGALKLGKVVSNFLGLSEAVGGFANSKAFSLLSKELTTWIAKGSIFATTLPLIAGGFLALGAAIASIEFDKYFDFEHSLKRLEEYEDKLKDVQNEIEDLQKKRANGKLTDAEKTHLAVLQAEERSLENQIALENERIKKAFQQDATSSKGGRYQERTGPTQLLDYNDALNKQVSLYEKMSTLRENIAYWESIPDNLITQEQIDLLEEGRKQIQDYEEDWTKVTAETSKAGSVLSAYYEQVKDAVPYEEMDAETQKVFDEMHKAFLQNQIDIDGVKDKYTDVSNALSNMIDTFGFHDLIDFDNIDISSLETVEDVVSKVQKQFKKLDKDAEINIEAKDKTGNVIGKIEGKKKDLTDEEWNMILRAQATGDWSKVEDYINSGKAPEDFTSVVTIEANASEAEGEKKEIEEPITTDVKFNPTNTKTISTLRSSYGQSIDTYVNFHIGSVPPKPKFASGKRKGEEGGLAWLGDEGSRNNPKPELVVSEDGTAYLAGTQGWEMRPIKSTDTVYSYNQTKKLLNGKQSFLGNVGQIPRYAKGKKTKKQKKREEFDKKLEALEHKRKVNHWTDKKYQTEYKKLYKKYKKWLSKEQKWERSESREDYQHDTDLNRLQQEAENILTDKDFANFKQKVNKNKNLSADEKKELIQQAGNKRATSNYDRSLGILSALGGDSGRLQSFKTDINKNTYLSKAEKADYIRQAYETVAQYNLKAYKNGVKTREDTLKSIKDYYKQVGQYDETYYKMLDELREADKEKELNRLEELKKNQDNRLTLAQKYLQKELNAINKQIDAEKEEAEELEKLTELEKELSKAKSKKIRVYREGVGFVYEQDVEAVEKAQKALTDYQDSLKKSDLEKRAEEIKSILDLFDELSENSAIKELELLLGVSGLSNLTNGITSSSSLETWTVWIKKLLAQSAGLSDLMELIEGSSDLSKWWTEENGFNVTDSELAQYFSKHSFANGTLSAPAGLAQVAERLKGELVWLGKGDSVYSNAVSRNLMEWGRYNPAQVMNSNNSASTQVFNFDQIVLPNVYNANDFYRELQNLPNKALQQSTRRA